MNVFDELFTIDDLEHEVDGGYLSVDHHPIHRAILLNYTSKAVFERRWNPVTTQCRGLIIDEEGNLLARPWRKFFSQGEPGAPTIAPDEQVVVMDKVDGSLGILFTPPGKATRAEITTRRRFYSPQGVVATEMLHEKYPHFNAPNRYTLLFEIVYPENRIIVDYGDTEDLVLLGGVDNRSGKPLPPEFFPEWPGPRVDKLYEGPFETARFLPDRPNREGVVVYAGGTMLKIKQQEYVALHKATKRMSAKVVWEEMGRGRTPEDIARGLPSHVQQWVKATADELLQNQVTIETSARSAFADILYEHGATCAANVDRRKFAAAAEQSEYRPYLFLLFDNKPIRPLIWKNIRPAGDVTPHRDEE